MPPGAFSSVSVNDNGDVVINYNNGQSQTIAQVPVVTFNAPDGLQSQNGQAFTATQASGDAIANSSGSGGSGSLVTSAVEEFERRHLDRVQPAHRRAGGLFGEHQDDQHRRSNGAVASQHDPVARPRATPAMSLNAALSIADSGLANINQQLALLSQNVANASTPSYAVETLGQQSLTAAGEPMGVLTGRCHREHRRRTAGLGVRAEFGGLRAADNDQRALVDRRGDGHSGLRHRPCEPGDQPRGRLLDPFRRPFEPDPAASRGAIGEHARLAASMRSATRTRPRGRTPRTPSSPRSARSIPRSRRSARSTARSSPPSSRARARRICRTSSRRRSRRSPACWP